VKFGRKSERIGKLMERNYGEENLGRYKGRLAKRSESVLM